MCHPGAQARFQHHATMSTDQGTHKTPKDPVKEQVRGYWRPGGYAALLAVARRACMDAPHIRGRTGASS